MALGTVEVDEAVARGKKDPTGGRGMNGTVAAMLDEKPINGMEVLESAV